MYRFSFIAYIKSSTEVNISTINFGITIQILFKSSLSKISETYNIKTILKYLTGRLARQSVCWVSYALSWVSILSFGFHLAGVKSRTEWRMNGCVCACTRMVNVSVGYAMRRRKGGRDRMTGRCKRRRGKGGKERERRPGWFITSYFIFLAFFM